MAYINAVLTAETGITGTSHNVMYKSVYTQRNLSVTPALVGLVGHKGDQSDVLGQVTVCTSL